MPQQDRGWTMIGLHMPHRDVCDQHGRRYRIGEEPHELTGRSRTVQLWACWLPMLLVGAMQYAFGAAIPAMTEHSTAALCWALACWAVLQAGAGFPVAHLRHRGRLDPRAVLVTGGVLCAAGVLSLHLGALPGYPLLGGTGAGLVYAVCSSTVQKWFPENAAARVGLVTGAFAYGATPLIPVLASTDRPRGLGLFALALLIAVCGCGLLITDPPRHWWPAHIDHQRWARGNPPAAREFSAPEALRTTTLPAMAGCLCCAATVSLFDAVFLVGMAGVPAAALFVATNGAGRTLAIPAARAAGTRAVLRAVLVIQATGQLVLAVALGNGAPTGMLLGALLAGIGGGAFYPLLAELARGFFGHRRSAEVHGLIYSAKAVSGVLGVGVGFQALSRWGFPATLLIAAGVALLAVLLCGWLRRPGLPSTLPRFAIGRS